MGTEALLREHISFLMSRDRTCQTTLAIILDTVWAKTPTANQTGDWSGGFPCLTRVRHVQREHMRM